MIGSSPLHGDGLALQQHVPRILAATSLKGYCRAEPEGPDDAFPTNSTLGPFDFFPGKYKVNGRWTSGLAAFVEHLSRMNNEIVSQATKITLSSMMIIFSICPLEPVFPVTVARVGHSKKALPRDSIGCSGRRRNGNSISKQRIFRPASCCSC